MSTEHVVAPSLFQPVIDYAAKLLAGGEADEVNEDNPLVDFAKNFLEQFSEGALGKSIIGFNERSLTQLRAERRNLAGIGGTEAVQKVIFRLEPLCTRLVELEYSDSESDKDEFHGEIMPDLLDEIATWTEGLDDEALRGAASLAAADYRRAVAGGIG